MLTIEEEFFKVLFKERSAQYYDYNHVYIMHYKMCNFIHKSTHLQLKCEEGAYPDGILTHLFKGQNVFVTDSDHKSI